MEILLVDDHALFRDGLSLLVRQLEDAARVHAVASAAEARAFVEAHQDLDLILLDYNLPDSTGLELLRQIKQQTPSTPIAMLSGEENPALIQSALQSGASGFITKTSSSDIMLSAVRLILNGGIYVPPAILGGALASRPAPVVPLHVASDITAGLRPRTQNFQLTDRQKEVLREMARGLSNKEIARELAMSPSTVKVHVAAILRELDVKNRTQVVARAQELGLCD